MRTSGEATSCSRHPFSHIQCGKRPSVRSDLSDDVVFISPSNWTAGLCGGHWGCFTCKGPAFTWGLIQRG
ncbi:hypothetical protein AMTR_s00066p00064850 [Amborella trichopoda]|uniref:Uncharacterized protein n=1 Tax=Amborella trichopoda TaxID=13333 RepID=U5DFA2_AMBTC|nr:hypothetical protein AMTR_s00066p00064850 [Amborella trichopoda]